MYSAITGDATIMGRLDAPPYMGRMPDSAKISKTKAALVITGDAVRDRPDRETQLYLMDIFAYSHDLTEDVYEDLLRIFGLSEARRIWKPLSVTTPAAKALIRFESADDSPDPTSELQHKIVRFRVRAARVIP